MRRERAIEDQTILCSDGEKSLHFFRSALEQLSASNGEDQDELARFEEIEDAIITGAVTVRKRVRAFSFLSFALGCSNALVCWNIKQNLLGKIKSTHGSTFTGIDRGTFTHYRTSVLHTSEIYRDRNLISRMAKLNSAPHHDELPGLQQLAIVRRVDQSIVVRFKFYSIWN